MKVNIYGITEATITFNSLGLTIRGNDGKPESIARNIDIQTEDQANELKQLNQLQLVRVEVIPEEQAAPQGTTPMEQLIAEAQQLNEVQTVEPPQSVEQPASEKPSDSRRQPTEESTEESTKESTEVVVMTESGPKSGKMTHKINGEIDETDERCKASMEAAKQLEEEENAPPPVIDESLLDPSERMGSQAVIGTGNGNAKTIDMKNSQVPRKEPEFINLNADESGTKEAFVDAEKVVDDTVVENAFVDSGVGLEEAVEDELGDEFVEI